MAASPAGSSSQGGVATTPVFEGTPETGLTSPAAVDVSGTLKEAAQKHKKVRKRKSAARKLDVTDEGVQEEEEEVDISTPKRAKLTDVVKAAVEKRPKFTQIEFEQADKLMSQQRVSHVEDIYMTFCICN